MGVKITNEGNKILVESPYHPAFIDGVKDLGGKWHAARKVWQVPAVNARELADLLLDVYGEDGHTPVERVTVEATLVRATGHALYRLGRCIAHRYSRDSRVELGEGVYAIAGKFPSRGGSAKYPAVLEYGDPVRLRIVDVPAGHPDIEAMRQPRTRIDREAWVDVDVIPASGPAQDAGDPRMDGIRVIGPVDNTGQ